MGALSFESRERVGVDAATLIYYVEDIEPYASLLQPVFESAVRDEVSISTSELSLLEVWIKPFRTGNNDLVEHYTRLLLWTGGLTMHPISRSVLERAARLRAAHKYLRTPDAIHLATALDYQCGIFLTNDTKLPIVDNITIVVLDDVLKADETHKADSASTYQT